MSMVWFVYLLVFGGASCFAICALRDPFFEKYAEENSQARDFLLLGVAQTDASSYALLSLDTGERLVTMGDIVGNLCVDDISLSGIAISSAVGGCTDIRKINIE